MRRIRVRKDGLTSEQREHKKYYEEGFSAGQKKENLRWKKKVQELQRKLEYLEKVIAEKLNEEAKWGNEMKLLQEHLFNTMDKLHKAEEARDAWRKQLRELSFEVKQRSV